MQQIAESRDNAIGTSWAELGQAQPAAGLVKLLLAAFFNWSKISLEVYWIDVQLPLIKKANCTETYSWSQNT